MHTSSPVRSVTRGSALLASVWHLAAILTLGLTCSLHAAVEDGKKPFDVPAGSAEKTLKQFSEQSGAGVIFVTAKVKGIATRAVKGEYTAQEALEQMLNDTPLLVTQDAKTGAFAVRIESPAEPKNDSSRPAGSRTARNEDGTLKLDTFEVMESKLLNMDIPRSINDPQPYVIFDRATLANSGATDLQDFLKTRLTMNTQSATSNYGTNLGGNSGKVSLRGLGINQTLILIDGHRASRPSASGGDPSQTDFEGIPMEAIERIEILPTTASGIYGGGATGGVINIILRRDYVGVETKFTYENSFDTDSALKRFDLSAGLTLEGGKTNILLALGYSEQAMLETRDRNFLQRGRAAIIANNPGFYLNATTPLLGATTNVRSVSGSPLFGPGTPNITYVPAGYAGGGGLTPLQANAGQYNLNLADGGQNAGGRAGLLTSPTVESISMTVRRQFSDTFQAFIDAGASKNTAYFPANQFTASYTLAATAPNNPFGQAVRVTVPTSSVDGLLVASNSNQRVVTGAIVRLPWQWQAEGDFTWDRTQWSERLTSGLMSGAESALISNGTIDVLRDTTAYPIDLRPYTTGELRGGPINSSLLDAVLRASGPVGQLPAGAPTLSGLLENRFERIEDGYNSVSGIGGTLFYPGRQQSIESVYLEAKVPLIAPANRIPLINALDLQLAGRTDWYKIKGATGGVLVGSTTPLFHSTTKLNSTNPTVGLSYRPVADILLRGSYSTGFLPPSLAQIVPQAPVTLPAGFIVDPKRGNVPGPAATLLGGGSSNLLPEESTSWSAGAVLTPQAIPGLHLSVDYTRIEKTNNIVALNFQTAIVNNEGLFPGRVVRGPLPSGDPYSVGPITLVDDTFINSQHVLVVAYDVALDYTKKTESSGTFTFFSSATWQPHYKQQSVSFLPETDLAGVASGNNFTPLKFRATGGVTWEQAPWTVGWTASYYDSYLVSTSAVTIQNQGNGGRVPSQVYHDVFARYQLPRATGSSSRLARWLDRTEFQVGVKNVFNRVPPLDVATIFMYSPYGDPRGAAFYVSVKKSF